MSGPVPISPPTAEKLGAAFRKSPENTPPAGLRRDNAAQALKELWVFAVSPETCNLACTHCLYAASPAKRSPYRLSPKELSGLMDQVRMLGARPHFLFTGGEPTLHSGLWALLEALDTAGYSFQVMTNGTRIPPKTAERLARLNRLAKVQISLESADPQAVDTIRGRGVYRRVLNAVSTLKEKGIAVTLAVSTMSSNEEGLPAVEGLAASKGADVKYISLYDLGAARENRLKPARQGSKRSDGVRPDLMCEKGVAYSEGSFYPCPVLVQEPATRLGDSLEEALSPNSRQRVARLHETHPACKVCLSGST